MLPSWCFTSWSNHDMPPLILSQHLSYELLFNQPMYSGKWKIIKIKNKEEFYKLVDPLKGRENKDMNKKKKNFTEMYSTFVIYNQLWWDSYIYTYPI